MSSRSSFQICQIKQDKAAHPFLERHKSALKTAQTAALMHDQLKKYHDNIAASLERRHAHRHITTSLEHAGISKKLGYIAGYHENRIDEINKGHASDKGHADEAKKIEASTTFSAEAIRCADTHHPLAPETDAAMERLAAKAAKLRLFDPPSGS